MKKFLIFFSLSVILLIGSYSFYEMSKLPRTYDGTKTNVYDIAQMAKVDANSSNYSINDEDGITSIIVKENLEKTHALNSVTAVTFDFRGYDTLGESFILLTAISGSIAIVRNSKKGGDGDNDEKTKIKKN